MPQKDVPQCQCPQGLDPEPHPDQVIHRPRNRLFRRLDDQPRRWDAAVASARSGHGGDCFVSRVTGLHVDTIRRGREDLADSVERRPTDRIHLPGGGRPALEKKSPRSSRRC